MYWLDLNSLWISFQIQRIANINGPERQHNKIFRISAKSASVTAHSVVALSHFYDDHSSEIVVVKILQVHFQ